MSDSNMPVGSQTKPRFGLSPGLSLLPILAATALVMLVSGCEEKSVTPVYAVDHIARYIRDNPIGAELFRTKGLFPSNEFVKPTDPGAVFRELVESSTRRIGTALGDRVNFGRPLNDLEFAEVSVLDEFRISTERTFGDDVDTTYDVRAINRHALFLRLNIADQDYGGWVLHAFNGDTLHSGFLDGTIVETEASFWGDQRVVQQIPYWVYQDRRVKDTTGAWVWVVDTVKRFTLRNYQPLAAAPIIASGDHISFSLGSDGVYQLMTVKTDSTDMVRVMQHPVAGRFIDTVTVPHNAPGQWNLVLFRTFVYPDRWGGAWVVPYRTAGD